MRKMMNQMKKFVTKRKGNRAEQARITVKYDVGFGNHLYIRGQGGGLSWASGTLMRNVGSDEWVWESVGSCASCEFKVLINDQQYETGENHHIVNGGVFQYTPSF